MDTEEDIEIKHARRSGHSQTDEGPYYHESWWESYKGSVKGKLGGLIIGALMGAFVGAVASGIFFAAGVAATAILPIIGGFAAAGMLYGAHEFGDIGKAVGSNAAMAEKLEKRLKSFIKKELNGLKKGTKSAPEEPENDEHYRTEHCDNHCPPKERKWVFWNIAAIGGIVGAAVGALLASAGFDIAILHHLGHAGHLLEPLAHTATITAMGLFGASFGVNRDMFRQVFDRTDLLFKGIFTKTPAKTLEKTVEKPSAPVTTIVYENGEEPAKSDTYHRDFVMAQAKKALLGMDHTKARPN